MNPDIEHAKPEISKQEGPIENATEQVDDLAHSESNYYKQAEHGHLTAHMYAANIM